MSMRPEAYVFAGVFVCVRVPRESVFVSPCVGLTL